MVIKLWLGLDIGYGVSWDFRVRIGGCIVSLKAPQK